MLWPARLYSSTRAGGGGINIFIYHSHSQHARGARTTALERARVVFVADTYTALPGAIRVLRRRARQSGARLAYYIATGGST